MLLIRTAHSFFEKVKGILESNNFKNFNLILDPLLDCDKYKHINNPRSRKVLLDIINIYSLNDIFCFLHPSLKRYTWQRKNPLQQARLDYFLISNAMQDIITACNINPSYRSDHSSIQFKIMQFERGKGLWKFNCSFLKEKKPS